MTLHQRNGNINNFSWNMRTFTNRHENKFQVAKKLNYCLLLHKKMSQEDDPSNINVIRTLMKMKQIMWDKLRERIDVKLLTFEKYQYNKYNSLITYEYCSFILARVKVNIWYLRISCSKEEKYHIHVLNLCIVILNRNDEDEFENEHTFVTSLFSCEPLQHYGTETSISPSLVVINTQPQTKPRTAFFSPLYEVRHWIDFWWRH